MKNLIKKILKESDEFDWVRDVSVNIFDLYDGIYFDINPSVEVVKKFVKQAIDKGIINEYVWDVNSGRFLTAVQLISKGYPFLILNPKTNSLECGSQNWENDNVIKYSEIKDMINESEEDDWGWINDRSELHGLKVRTPMGGEINLIDDGGKYITLKWDGGGSTNFYSRESVKAMIESGTWTVIKESEEDDWDWVREIPPHIPFEHAVVGRKYRIEPTTVLLDAVRNCGEYEEIFNAKEAVIGAKDYLKYNAVYCDHERDDQVVSLRLHLDLGEAIGYTYFWVTEDMVTLYPIDYYINESEEDDWGWIREIRPFDLKSKWVIQYNTLKEFKELEQWLFRNGAGWSFPEETKRFQSLSDTVWDEGVLVNVTDTKYDRVKDPNTVTFDGWGPESTGWRKNVEEGIYTLYQWSDIRTMVQ